MNSSLILQRYYLCLPGKALPLHYPYIPTNHVTISNLWNRTPYVISFCISIVMLILHFMTVGAPHNVMYNCEVCDHIHLRAWILRYCIVVGRMLLLTCCVDAFGYCVALRVELGVTNWHKWLIPNDTWFNEPWVFKLFFNGKGPYALLWSCSVFAHEKIASGFRNPPNYCGWLPSVGDPCRKRNCMLKRSHYSCQEPH